MPNDIVRSVSDFFNRSRRERKSGRQQHHHRHQQSSDASNTFVRSNPVEIRPQKPQVQFK